MRLEELETPALVVEKEPMERNMDKMTELLAGSKLKLRPHYKTHKSPWIAKMQLEKGAVGITCSKLSEAEDLADAGVENILIANQVVQPQKVKKLAALAGRCQLTVCVDQLNNIRDISREAVSAGTHVHCYVEMNIGMNRCGVDSFQECYELAKALEELPGVSYDGIQAYAGHLAHEYDTEKQERETAENEEYLKRLTAYLEERGISTKEVSGASTGTAYLKRNSGVYTEIQAGSYIFLDRSYGRLHLNLFEHALFVMATVISSHDSYFVIDAGVKSLCPDQDMPAIEGFDAAEVKINEEHMVFRGSHSYQVGDMVRVIPGHCCSTVNLYDEMYVVQNGRIIDKPAVTSRGKSQ